MVIGKHQVIHNSDVLRSILSSSVLGLTIALITIAMAQRNKITKMAEKADFPAISVKNTNAITRYDTAM